MATYTVRGGDSLSAIAKKLGISGGWQELYQTNKETIGSNANLIRPGQVLTYGSTSTGGNTTTSTPAPTPPSQEVIEGLTNTLGDATMQNFIDKYGAMTDYYDADGNLVQGLRPDEIYQAMADERVNPEQNRIATQAMVDYSRGFGAGGGYMSGNMQANRSAYVNQLERNRKTAVDEYVQAQNTQFADWYNQQMYNYQTSKAPNDYQLGNLGIAVPVTGDPYKVGTQYNYDSPVDFSGNMFKYGGYTAPPSMYGTVTPVENS